MPSRKNLLTDYFSRLDDSRSRAYQASLLLIITIGFLLRWFSLYEGHAYTFFTIKDEITALKYAFGFMAGDPLTYYLGSPALNQGQIPGPLWAMFVAALYKLGGNSIEGAIFWMILLNTLVIYLVYRLARHMMSARYALFTALFYSLSPWAIYYSAGLYNPMVLALFGVLLYLALWQTLTTDHSRAILWVVVISAAIPQFHMIGIFYYPAVLLLLLLNPGRTNWRWLTAGLIIGLLLYVPYFIGEIHHHWANLHNVLHSTEKFSSGVFKVITTPLGMLTNHPGEWPGYTTTELISFADRWFGSYLILLIINIASFVLAVLFMARFIRRFYHEIRASKLNFRKAFLHDREHIFIGVLIFLPLLLYILTGKAYATRYSIILFPLLFLLPALYLDSINHQRLKNIVIYTLSVMFVVNIYLVLSFYTDQNRKMTQSSQFVPAFYKLEKLYRVLRKNAGAGYVIKVDTADLMDKDNKYWDITTNSIKTFFALNQENKMKKTSLNNVKEFYLVDVLKKVPANASIVYRDNGLIAYTRK